MMKADWCISGCGYGSKRWTDNEKYIRIFTKIGTARSTVTRFVNEFKCQAPRIVEFNCVQCCVFDKEQERIDKFNKAKTIKKLNQKKLWNELGLKRAEEKLKRVQDEINKLKN